VSLDVGKKTDKVAEDWTAGGNEFQVTDAATGNERRPTVQSDNLAQRHSFVQSSV